MSVARTSSRDFNEWLEVFADPLMGSAAMDRLLHPTVVEVLYTLGVAAKPARGLTCLPAAVIQTRCHPLAYG